MRRMKGFSMPEDIGMTVVFLVVIVVMMLIAFLLFLKVKIPTFSEEGFARGQLITYQIDFLSIANKPFMLADVMTSMQSGDRTILEKSIESAAVGSLDKAAANDPRDALPDSIEGFMKNYNNRYYSVVLKSGKDEITTVESDTHRCGEQKKGWCVRRRLVGDNCDVGRVEIDSQGFCSLTEVCCKADKDLYLSQPNPKQYITCGKGVCSSGRKLTVWIGTLIPTPASAGTFCDTGQIYLGKPTECAGTNAPTTFVSNIISSPTEVCCAPATEENLVSSAGATRVVIPLLFKDKIGALEVTAK